MRSRSRRSTGAPRRGPAHRGRPCSTTVDALACERLGHGQADALHRAGHQGALSLQGGRVHLGSFRPMGLIHCGALRRVAQLGLQHLAVVVLRQCLDEQVALGTLEAGDVLQAVVRRASRCVEALPRLRHDEGDDDLAPLGIGRADHRHLGHAGRRQQHLLDLARVDVGAAADQQVLAAVLQGQEAILVQAADVAGPEPAVAQRRRRWPRGCASSRPSRCRRAPAPRRSRRRQLGPSRRPRAPAPASAPRPPTPAARGDADARCRRCGGARARCRPSASRPGRRSARRAAPSRCSARRMSARYIGAPP